MPPPSSRMTQQPERPGRYYSGKELAPEPDSGDESVGEDEDDDDDDNDNEPTVAAKAAPAPKATSFPSHLKVSAPASKVQVPASTSKGSRAEPAEDLSGFVTASSSDGSEDGGSGSESGSSSEDDDDDDEDSDSSSASSEPRRPLLRPKFIPKAQRMAAQAAEAGGGDEAAQKQQEKVDELLEAHLAREAAARAAGRKGWDDDEGAASDEVDDTDGRDPEAERAAWKLRELQRVQRDRAALVAREKEREEIERRRNMSAEDREREDRAFLDQQQDDRDARGKMAFMQKYFHKGAFYQDPAAADDQDDDVRRALERSTAGAKFVDETGDKALLPEYMRIRDMNRLGKKGRTKYRDLKSEDTGRWGQFDRKHRDDDGLDERFRADDPGRAGKERTGANVAPLGERRRKPDDSAEPLRDRDDKRRRYD